MSSKGKMISDDPLLHLSGNNIMFKKMNGFFLILNPDVPNMMVADDVGKRIFELCNGKRTLSEVVVYICSEHNLDKGNVENYIQSLIRSDFLTTEPPSFREELRTSEVLNTLILHVTEGCNLRCKHCYFASGKPLADEMGELDFLNLIREFARLGGKNLLISGGEPLLRREMLHQVIKEASRHEMEKIVINTNGTLIAEEDGRIFKEHNAKVCISLDGASSQTHNYIRGEGSFEKALNGIKTMVNAGVYTTIGTTLMKPNLHEANDVLFLAKNLGVPSVDFVMLKIKGRAKENEEDLAFSFEDMMYALKDVLKTSKEVGVKTSIEEFQSTVKTLSRRNLCGAGIGLLGIAANGDVYPCDALHEKPLKAGNVREQSLEEIWKTSPVLKALQKLSVNSIEGCQDCELKLICGNGCPADSFVAYGDFNKCSPLCSILKELHWQVISDLARELWQKA